MVALVDHHPVVVGLVGVVALTVKAPLHLLSHLLVPAVDAAVMAMIVVGLVVVDLVDLPSSHHHHHGEVAWA